jgi:hypothetical protein
MKHKTNYNRLGSVRSFLYENVLDGTVYRIFMHDGLYVITIIPPHLIETTRCFSSIDEFNLWNQELSEMFSADCGDVYSPNG